MQFSDASKPYLFSWLELAFGGKADAPSYCKQTKIDGSDSGPGVIAAACKSGTLPNEEHMPARAGRQTLSLFVRLRGSEGDGSFECYVDPADDTRAATGSTRSIDTVEVCGSNPHGPTTSFS
jgi:hypothetical protein